MHGFCCACGEVLLSGGSICDRCEIRARSSSAPREPFEQTDLLELLESCEETEAIGYIADTLGVKQFVCLGIVALQPGATAAELEDAVGESSRGLEICTRLGELEALGLVGSLRERRCTVSGRMARCWTLTDRGAVVRKAAEIGGRKDNHERR